MINRIATAIAAFQTANAAIPVTAEDDQMDKAVHAAGDALDLVIRIPAFTRDEALTKLEFATNLVEWEDTKARLIERAQTELMAALHAERTAA